MVHNLWVQLTKVCCRNMELLILQAPPGIPSHTASLREPSAQPSLCCGNHHVTLTWPCLSSAPPHQDPKSPPQRKCSLAERSQATCQPRYAPPSSLTLSERARGTHPTTTRAWATWPSHWPASILPGYSLENVVPRRNHGSRPWTTLLPCSLQPDREVPKKESSDAAAKVHHDTCTKPGDATTAAP